MRLALKSFPLLLTLVLSSVACLASSPLLYPSAFAPSLKSRLQSSLLDDTLELEIQSLPSDRPGLELPFIGPKSFADAVLEALSLQPEQPEIRGDQILLYYPPTIESNWTDFVPRRRDMFRYNFSTLKYDFRSSFRFLAGYEQDFTPDGDYGFLYKGWIINARINDNISLNTGWWSGEYFGDQASAAQDPLIDSWSSTHSERISLDNATADLNYRDRILSVSLGRGKYTIGNNISGSIILSDKVNDYGYLLAEARLGEFRISLLNATLQADSTYSIYDNAALNAKNYPDKYLALHQISYLPGDRLDIYAGETVVYGNRNWDLNYLLPAAFWRAIEHNLRDRDNVLIYAGASWEMSPGLLLYLQGALDEMSYSKLFSNWWGNKYAVKTGFSTLLPRLWESGDLPQLSAEITAVRPFTYTHYMNHTMYSHDQCPLGYAKGSNLVDISIELYLPLMRHLGLVTAFSKVRQGSFGSSWQTNYLDAFSGNQQSEGEADWFQGTVQDYYTLSSSLKIDLLSHHKLLLAMCLSDQMPDRYSLAWQFRY